MDKTVVRLRIATWFRVNEWETGDSEVAGRFQRGKTDDEFNDL